MKRILVIALSALFVLGLFSVSYAFHGAGQDNGRISAMGLKNFQTTDLANTWVNPAFIVNYKNKAYGFLASGDWTVADTTATTTNSDTASAWGGVHLDSPVGVWGLWIGRKYDGHIDHMDDAVGTAGFGTAVGEPIDSTTGLPIGPDTLNALPTIALGTNVDLFWGMDIGAALIGARVNYNANNSENNSARGAEANAATTPKNTINKDDTMLAAREIGIHVGVALKELPIGVSVLVGMPSLEATADLDTANTNAGGNRTAVITEKLESDGALNLGVYANGQLKMSDKTTLVPTVFFESEKFDSKKNITAKLTDSSFTTVGTTDTFEYVEDGKRKESTTTFGFDAAFNMKPNDKTLAVAAVGLTIGSGEEELENTIVTDKSTNVVAGVTTTNQGTLGVDASVKEETSSFSIPIVFGIENKTWSKVTTRLGLKSDLYKRSKTETTTANYYDSGTNPATSTKDYEVKTESITSGTSAVKVTMGFSVSLGENFGLTAVLNKDILRSGGYLVSGISEALCSSVSVAYSF